MTNNTASRRGVGASGKKRKAQDVEESQAPTTTITDEQKQERRQNLEILRLDSMGGDPARNAQLVHQKMADLCRSNGWTEQAPMSGRDFSAKARELHKEGVTVEDLEEQCFPKEKETPRKRTKKSGKKGKAPG